MQQVVEARKSELSLGLDSARSADVHPERTIGRIVQQRRLSDPGLSAEDERPTGAFAPRSEERIQSRAFGLSP